LVAFPGCNKVVIFTLGVVPDLEHHGAKAAAAPTESAKLFRIVTLLVNEVHLIEYILRFHQADTVFSLDVPALVSIELESHRSV
jgi:hypothetical protein